MFGGSCCCGAVRFRLLQKPKLAVACHCSRCRKVGATPFAIVDAESFELSSGGDQIVQYRPEPSFKFTRSFCGKCGTSLGEMGGDGKSFPIPLNCLDDDLGLEIRFHEHVAGRPGWDVIPEGSKQFEGDPG
jgi:hypothetical protein